MSPKSHWISRHPHTAEYRVFTYRGENDDNLPENDMVFATELTHETVVEATVEMHGIEAENRKVEAKKTEKLALAQADRDAEMLVCGEWKEI